MRRLLVALEDAIAAVLEDVVARLDRSQDALLWEAYEAGYRDGARDGADTERGEA